MEIDVKKLKETGIKLEDRDYTKEDPQKMFCPDGRHLYRLERSGRTKNSFQRRT